MMKKFERPEMKIAMFAAENVATTASDPTRTAHDGAKSWLTTDKGVSSIADFFGE